MSQYTTAIPPKVFAQVPEVMKNHQPHMAHPGPFEVKIMAFPGDDEGQMFAIEVWTNAQREVPADKRSKPFNTAIQTEYFFDAEGNPVDEPVSHRTRWPS